MRKTSQVEGNDNTMTMHISMTLVMVYHFILCMHIKSGRFLNKSDQVKGIFYVSFSDEGMTSWQKQDPFLLHKGV